MSIAPDINLRCRTFTDPLTRALGEKREAEDPAAAGPTPAAVNLADYLPPHVMKADRCLPSAHAA
jgi:hypothetical protein